MYVRSRRGLLCLLSVIACMTETMVTLPAAAALSGAFETVDQNGVASGWATDASAPSQPISVHAYVDGPAGGGGTFIASVSANVPRAGAASAGFRFPIPTPLWDGRPHRLYVYAIAASGVAADNIVLPGSPQTFVLNSTVIRLDNGVIRLGVEPRCGGTLVELSVAGHNLVNNSDCTGRQVQAALYDGNAA